MGRKERIGVVKNCNDIGTCDFDPYPPDHPDADDPEGSWHHLKECQKCGETWFGLHCDCDGHQNPCPSCGFRNVPLTECPCIEEYERGEGK
jgi:hypothetical protein